jgi:hypothetical protein
MRTVCTYTTQYTSRSACLKGHRPVRPICLQFGSSRLIRYFRSRSVLLRNARKSRTDFTGAAATYLLERQRRLLDFLAPPCHFCRHTPGSVSVERSFRHFLLPLDSHHSEAGLASVRPLCKSLTSNGMKGLLAASSFRTPKWSTAGAVLTVERSARALASAATGARLAPRRAAGKRGP